MSIHLHAAREWTTVNHTSSSKSERVRCVIQREVCCRHEETQHSGCFWIQNVEHDRTN